MGYNLHISRGQPYTDKFMPIAPEEWKRAVESRKELTRIEMLEGENSLDELYVALEDSNGNRYAVYAPGNAVGSGEWMALDVPYTDFVGVNMSRIKKISFGVGNASNSTSGKGIVFIDSIGYGHSLD